MAFSRSLNGSASLSRAGTQFSALWGVNKGTMTGWYYVATDTTLVSNAAPYNLAAICGAVNGNIGVHLGNLVLGGGITVDCVGMYYFNNTGQAPFARVQLTRGEWCFFVAEFTDADSGTLKITVYSPSNGKQTSTLTGQGSVASFTQSVQFGHSFTGLLDDLAVYNDLLSEADKDALYAENKTPEEIASCTGYWLLDDDVAGETSDIVGGFSLALNSNPTADPHNHIAIPDPNTGTLKTSITVLDCRIAFSAPVDVYKYNGGGYYVVASGGISVTGMSVLDTTNTYVGRVMANPTGINLQGWDNRLDGGANGPGLIFSSGAGYNFPVSLDTIGRPGVLQFYRGLDSPTGGLGSTWCKARIMLGSETGIQPSAICPSFIGTSGNKIRLSITGVNLTPFTLVTVPSTASEKFWNDDKGYFKHPFSPIGPFLTSALVTPLDTMHEYMADQSAKGTGPLMLGAISNSTFRNELIYRLLGLAANIKAYNNIGSGTFFMGAGGFGYGYATPMFLASLFLNDTSYNEWPADLNHPTTNNLVPYYGEGQAFFGDPTTVHSYGIPLFGTNNESPPFPYNHNATTTRALELGLEEITLGNNGTLLSVNPEGSLSRLGHQLPRFSFNAPSQVGAGPTGLILPATGISIPVGYTHPVALGERLYIYAGTGSGQTREILAYSSGANAICINGAWSTQPDDTSRVRVLNGGAYMATNMYSLSSHTMVPILISKTTEFINNDERRNALLAMLMRWTEYDDGLLGFPWPGEQYLGSSEEGRKFGDVDANWASVFHTQYSVGDWRPASEGGGSDNNVSFPFYGGGNRHAALNRLRRGRTVLRVL